MNLTYLGHSAFRIDAGAARVLIDPFLTHNPSFAASGLTVAAVQAGITHVVVTHGHGDHLGDTVAICQATGATLVSTHEICDWLSGDGGGTVQVAKVDPGAIGGEVDTGSMRVAFTPALHSSSTSTPSGPLYLGSPAGVVLTFASDPGRPVYHMGDTGIFSDMALIHELYQPRIGIVPIGGRYTMDARHAALACTRYFQFETVFPCHYGTFGLLAPTADAFTAALPAGLVRVPKPGETVVL